MDRVKWSWAFGLVTLALSACEPGLPDKIGFAGQSALLQSGTQVTFQDAWVKRDVFRVRLWAANMSQGLMYIDRDGFALRLPDGRVLPRHGAVHGVYTLPPGGGHEVFVDFKDRGADLRTYQGASLIVGGISFSTDPRPRVVGEIPLVPTGAR